MEKDLPEDPLSAHQDNGSTPDTVEGQTPPQEFDLWPEGTPEVGDAEDRTEGVL